MAGWRCLTSPTPRSPAMTVAQAKLSVAAAKKLLKGNPDGLREVVRAVLQEVLEAEMTDALGAAKGERSAGRLGCSRRARATMPGRAAAVRPSSVRCRSARGRRSDPTSLLLAQLAPAPRAPRQPRARHGRRIRPLR